MTNRQPVVALLWFALLFTSASVSASSEVVRGSPLPSWVVTRAVAISKADAEPLRESPGGIEYLLIDSQSNLSAEAKSHRNVYRITSQAGLSEFSTVVLSFDPSYETLEIHSLRIWRDGVARQALNEIKMDVIQQEKDLERNLFNGRLSAILMLRDLRVGDIVDCEFTRTGANPVFKGKYFDTIYCGWRSEVREQHARILAPKGRILRSANQGSVTLKKRVSSSAEETEYLWSGNKLPAVASDENEPSWYVRFPMVEISEYQDWREVAGWAAELFRPVELTSALRQQSESIVQAAMDKRVFKGAGLFSSKPSLLETSTLPEGNQKYAFPNISVTDLTKVEALLDFVQKEIRYMGIEMGPYSHQPNDPSEVIARRYGDCKDKARLLCTLLSVHGISAEPVLVNTYRGRRINQQLSSPGIFNHVIVRIKLGDCHFFVDPTRVYQKGSLFLRLPGEPSMGLIVKAGEISPVEIPMAEAAEPKLFLNENYVVDGYDTPSKVEVSMKYSGTWAEGVRAYLATASNEDRDRYYTNYFKERHPVLERIGPITCKDDEQLNSIEVVLSFIVPNLWEKKSVQTGMRQAEFWHLPLRSHYLQPGSLARTSPYALSYPLHIEAKTSIHLPDNWNIPKQERSVDSAFFTFKDHYFAEGRNAHYQSTWRYKAPEVPLNRLQAYVSELAKVRNTVGVVFFKNLDFQAKLDRAGVNWYMIFVTIVAIAGSIYFCLWFRRTCGRATSLTPLSQAAPSIGGWLILPSIGLILSPLRLIGSLLPQLKILYSEHDWLSLADSESAAYVPYWGSRMSLQHALNMFLLCWVISCLIWFFQRKACAPTAMVILFSSSVAVQVIDFSMYAILLPPDPAHQATVSVALAQSVVGAAIWIPYFLSSKRVKRTFIA